MIAAYFNKAFSLGVDLDLNSVFSFVPNEGGSELRGEEAFAFAEDARVPRIIASHKPWRAKFFEHQRIVLLVRSPHDALLSTYRGIEWRADSRATFERFLFEDERGVLSMCQYLNSWAAHMEQCDALPISYEQMISGAGAVLRRVIAHLELAANDAAIEHAVEYARYDNMKRLNLERGIGGKEGSRSDDDLLRVREGVVGGHKKALTSDQIQQIDDVLAVALTDTARSLLADLAASTMAHSQS